MQRNQIYLGHEPFKKNVEFLKLLYASSDYEETEQVVYHNHFLAKEVKGPQKIHNGEDVNLEQFLDIIEKDKYKDQPMVKLLTGSPMRASLRFVWTVLGTPEYCYELTCGYTPLNYSKISDMCNQVYGKHLDEISVNEDMKRLHKDEYYLEHDKQIKEN